MKKKFEIPELIIVLFANEDIITNSNGGVNFTSEDDDVDMQIGL